MTKQAKTNLFVISNGIEWYAGTNGYLVFSKSKSQTNLYATRNDAKKVLEYVIPARIVRDKKLEIVKWIQPDEQNFSWDEVQQIINDAYYLGRNIQRSPADYLENHLEKFKKLVFDRYKNLKTENECVKK